jgi:phosphoglycerol transferase MdoB-like AlkP superfamily enzyme
MRQSLNHNQTSRQGTTPFQAIRAQIGFLFGCAFVFLAVFALLRALLLYRNFDLTTDIPASNLVRSFGVGLRFDLIIVCYCMIPLVFSLLLRSGPGLRKVCLYWLGFCGAICIFLGIAELDFYREFHARLNSIAFQYLKEDPKTVLRMLWFGFPVARYLLLCGFLWSLFVGGLLLVNNRFPAYGKSMPTPYRPAVHVIAFFLVLLLGVVGARGTLRAGPPLRWGDAYFSRHTFANHLSLNGTFTLVKALSDIDNQKKKRKWLHALPQAEATAVTREMLVTDRDELLETDRFAVLRKHRPIIKLKENRIRNVVVIIMESFSAEFVGALQRDFDVTPEFDKLADEGLLFDHFFSNGTHTHQGMFASLASFPNIPGHEYLMQQPQGQNAFSGLPVLLKERGFSDLYVYNGDFAWDNQEGFFRNQGMTRFVGRKDYQNPKYVNPTWGVSDEDMYSRALIELEEIAKKSPFYAILQTLSNHTPYVLPSPLPVDPVPADASPLSEHLTAMKYSDWALGQFFRAAKQSSYYDETLFVITGDHGFGLPQQLAGIDILMFHVPLLLIGPGIREAYGNRSSIVGTQVDIVPTIAGLLGQPFVHQSWGRDLLALPEDDRGFGVIKPSGSNQTTALIKGEYVLTRTPDEKFVLARYKLYPHARAEAVDDATRTKEMTKELLAYIQTAMSSLYANRTGRN